jgi:hypothetical protein
VLWGMLAFGACHRSTVSGRMSDQEFWRLSEAISEPAGTFSLSDNLVSNEPHMAETIRWLRPTGGVYVGVGPEQNFSYIATLRPAIAFIVDIRRENRDLHLLYKALFELSADRVDFVSRLFSRPRPAGLGSAASVDEIFRQYTAVTPSPDQFNRTAALVRERLLQTHTLPLTPHDVDWIEHVLKAFYTDGPEIQFWGSRTVDAVRPSYWQLMTGTDMTGQARSFLSTDDGFRFVKAMQMRNLIIPVVGDFGGPAAIRRIGEYARAHRVEVHAFYGSNVGVYLNTEQARAFCRSLATLPVANGAWYIERDGSRPLSAKLRSCAPATK